MLSSITSWYNGKIKSKYLENILYIISFAESSFFPLPPDPILISICIKNRDKIFRYTFFCMISSVIGGFLGYFIGLTLFDAFGEKILKLYAYENTFNNIVKQFHNYAFIIISLKGLTPIPFKIVTIASGVARVDLLTFLLASIISRSFRFFSLAGICYFFSDKVKSIFEKNKFISIFAIILVTILGFIILK